MKPTEKALKTVKEENYFTVGVYFSFQSACTKAANFISIFIWMSVMNTVFPFHFTVAYIIWYGTWTTAAKNIILTFVKNVGTTAWWKINNAYGGVGALTFGAAAADAAYSQGKTLSNPWNVVQNAFNKNLLPKNTNGVYLVLSSRYVGY